MRAVPWQRLIARRSLSPKGPDAIEQLVPLAETARRCPLMDIDNLQAVRRTSQPPKSLHADFADQRY